MGFRSSIANPRNPEKNQMMHRRKHKAFGTAEEVMFGSDEAQRHAIRVLSETE
jgi:hypothetical protein